MGLGALSTIYNIGNWQLSRSTEPAGLARCFTFVTSSALGRNQRWPIVARNQQTWQFTVARSFSKGAYLA